MSMAEVTRVKRTGDSMSMAAKRSDYSDEDQPKSEPGDPLAELARLIGQSDPFTDVGRAGARKPLDGAQRRRSSRARMAGASGARPSTTTTMPAAPPRDAYRADPRYHRSQDDHAGSRAPIARTISGHAGRARARTRRTTDRAAGR